MRNYIVMDLEWNQSSEGKEKENRELPFEIVEIGAVKLDGNKKEISQFSRLIKPQIYMKMHYMTKKIVHLNMDELEEGDEFQIVMKDFLEWCGDDYVFCTWGNLDLLELQRNMNFYHMEPLSNGPLLFLDIQKFFSIAFEDGKSRRTLEYAVDYLNIEKDENFHRATVDAHYTALVFSQMNHPEVESHFSYDYYHTPMAKEEEIHVVFDNYSKYISREFRNKTLAMADKEVTLCRCYVCGKSIRKKVKWFSVNGKHYYCLGYCSEHGYLRGKIRMKKSENGNIYVVKTIKLVSKEDAVKVIEKQENIRKQRKVRRRSKETVVR